MIKNRLLSQDFQAQVIYVCQASKINFAVLFGLSIAIAMGSSSIKTLSAYGFSAQENLLTERILSSSPLPVNQLTASTLGVSTSTSTSPNTAKSTSVAKFLARAANNLATNGSADKFLAVKAENLQPYRYKSGLFELDIPADWIPIDNSKTGETIVLWFDPTKNALITVDIFNVPDGMNSSQMIGLLQNFLRNTFNSKPGFFMEEPIPQADGSIQIVWGYVETIQGATGIVQGNSFIQKIDNKVSLLTTGVLHHQYDDLLKPMTRIINSYKVNASVSLTK
jgi:hypothetical protein